jgi:AraC family transcriptional regulator
VSGEKSRDFKVYCRRMSFFPEVPEHETVEKMALQR